MMPRARSDPPTAGAPSPIEAMVDPAVGSIFFSKSPTGIAKTQQQGGYDLL
jgi:hypothetical protein